MKNNYLGQIDNLYLVLANSNGVHSNECIKLIELVSFHNFIFIIMICDNIVNIISFVAFNGS